jgi:hypothetical protein
MNLKDMSEAQQVMHAKTFDGTLAMLQKVNNPTLAAVAIIHASIFFLARNNSRREIYNWLQRICDDLVI